MITAFGETKPLSAWARDPRCVVGPATLRNRIDKQGWDAERAITAPVTDPHQCNSKLTAEQVATMRKRLVAGEPASVIAPEFGITVQHLQEIARGAKWRSAGA